MNNNTSEITISVVIPTYFSEDFVEQSLVSVCEQTYPCCEIIVSDDGSTDQTVQRVRAVLARYPLIRHTVIENTHQGPGATRNSGAACATGDWIAFLDSDDTWQPDKLEQVALAIERFDPTFVFHNEQIYDPASGQHRVLPFTSWHNPSVHPFLDLYRRNYLSPSSALVRRTLFEASGGFDPSLLSAQDYELWLRMALLPEFRLCAVDRCLTTWLKRGGSITTQVDRRLRALLRIYEQYQPHVRALSPHPRRDLLRFKGKIYSGCGLMALRQGEYFSGAWNILRGNLIWPRLDWFSKGWRCCRAEELKS